ncbi:hypothetical protein FIU86_09780 [Roseovarius sp. THAF9]|nr:hypothetical protein FIU86_09780 [Roseovarius sp. THAF9]
MLLDELPVVQRTHTFMREMPPRRSRRGKRKFLATSNQMSRTRSRCERKLPSDRLIHEAELSNDSR